MCAACLWRPEKKIGSLETVVIGNYELPCGCCELNPGLSKKKKVISASKHEALSPALVLRHFKLCQTV